MNLKTLLLILPFFFLPSTFGQNARLYVMEQEPGSFGEVGAMRLLQANGQLVGQGGDPMTLAVNTLPKDLQELFGPIPIVDGPFRMEPDGERKWKHDSATIEFQDDKGFKVTPNRGKPQRFLPITARKALEGNVMTVGTEWASFKISPDDKLQISALENFYLLNAKVVDDTPNQVKLAVGDGQAPFSLTRGRTDTHWVLEFMGAKFNTIALLEFGDRGPPGPAEAEVPLAEAIGIVNKLQRLSPLVLRGRYARKVLDRMDGYPTVPKEIKTSTELFNKILSKHPDLTVEAFSGKPGATLTAANNLWCIVIDERREIYGNGFSIFSKNFKPASLKKADVEAALAETTAFVGDETIMSTKRPGLFRLINRRGENVTILRP